MVLDHVNINRDIDDISMVRGDTLAFNFEVQGVTDSVDLDGASFTVKSDKNDIDTVFQLSLGDGIESLGDGVYSVRARPDLTADLEPNTYYYDLLIVIGYDKFTIMNGKLIIKKGVTE